MPLRLPTYQDLTEAQRGVIELPLDGSYLVTGPPGSGKTVVAIHRASTLARSGEPVLLLMYGKVLSTYVSGSSELLGLPPGSVSTFHSWFPKWFSSAYGRTPPKVGPWIYDWAACIDIIGSAPLPDGRPHILVDEGQDMPPEFYMLARALGRTLTVFGDQNQTIHDGNSTIEEISTRGRLGRAVELDVNFRNTRSIAEFAAEFWEGAGAPPGKVVEGAERGDKPVLAADATMEGLVKRIARFEKLNAHQDIGVLVQHSRTLRAVYAQLDRAGLVNPVQGYLSDRNRGGGLRPLNFSKRGVKLLTWQSAKGLQFDTVFVPELQLTPAGDLATDRFRMQMYVLATRASRELFLTYTGDGEPGVVGLLPMEKMDDFR